MYAGCIGAHTQQYPDFCGMNESSAYFNLPQVGLKSFGYNPKF